MPSSTGSNRYRRHFEARGLGEGKSDAVTVVQRVSSDLRLNPHFHTIALDGVYVEGEHGDLGFHPLPCLTNANVADILQIASTRILRLLRQKGVVEDDAVNADESLADNEPALAELAVATTLGRIPAGPALRQKDPIRLRPGRPWRELLMRSFKIDIEHCAKCGARISVRVEQLRLGRLAEPPADHLALVSKPPGAFGTPTARAPSLVRPGQEARGLCASHDLRPLENPKLWPRKCPRALRLQSAPLSLSKLRRKCAPQRAPDDTDAISPFNAAHQPRSGQHLPNCRLQFG